MKVFYKSELNMTHDYTNTPVQGYPFSFQMIMDWKQCIICQATKKEGLKCPVNSKRKDAGAGYNTLVRDAREFSKIGVTVIKHLDVAGEDICTILNENRASWHKSCRDLFNDTKLQRAKKRALEDVEDQNDGNENLSPTSPVKSRRSSSVHYDPQRLQCFFCEEYDCLENLHCASTLQVTKNVRDCAVLLNDNKLIAKLSSGDLVAIDAKYHTNCLVNLYNKARHFRNQTSKHGASDPPLKLDELAFAELIAYIEEILEVNNPAVLTLSELVKFFKHKLQELGAEHENVNATRLKERVIKEFPDLTAHSQGREVLLVLKHEIGGILSDAKRDSDVWCLARVTHILRRDILRVNNSFNGTFSSECQKESIPRSLLSLIGMLVKGPSTKIDPSDNQACLSIAQLVVFNSVSRARQPEPTTTHHIRSRECPLPIYTALKIHGATRDRSLIDAFYRLGLSLSYDRFLTVSTEITNSVLARYTLLMHTDFKYGTCFSPGHDVILLGLRVS